MWTWRVLAHDVGRSGVHTRAQTLFGYFVPDKLYPRLSPYLPSRLASRARLTVDAPTRALWLAGIFLRRKKICAGVVGTRTDWVLKGEEGGMTTPLLQYVARFDGGGENFGFGRGGYKESSLSCSLFVGFPSLFVAPSGEKPALPTCVGRGQACPPFPVFSIPYTLFSSLGRAL